MRPSRAVEFLTNAIKKNYSILLQGGPGVGKTEIIKTACANAGVECIISHPAVSDQTEYQGFPFVVDGEAIFIAFNHLKRLIETKVPLVFFFDDLGQAAAAIQACCMHMLLERSINGKPISPYVTFFAATNRKEDRAGVTGILEPVKSRFVTIIEIVPDEDDWIRWAINNDDIPDSLIGFIRYRGHQLLYDFKPTTDLTNSPCPRTIHNVGKLVTMGMPEGSELELIKGAAGEAFGLEYTGWLQSYGKLPPPDAMLLNPDQFEIADDPAIQYAVCGAIASRASEKNFKRVIKIADKLPRDFSILLVRDSMKKCPEVVNTTAFIEYSINHKEVFV